VKFQPMLWTSFNTADEVKKTNTAGRGNADNYQQPLYIVL